jgi:hypothetical protein
VTGRDVRRDGSIAAIFGLFVVFPAALGVVGAAVGLAIWLLGRVFRRLVY